MVLVHNYDHINMMYNDVFNSGKKYAQDFTEESYRRNFFSAKKSSKNFEYKIDKWKSLSMPNL